MEKLKKICLATIMGFFGFGLGVCVAPIAAVAIVLYMTKISAEVGYSDNLGTTYEDDVKDMNDYLDRFE